MSLDINTPKGRITLMQERQAARLFERKFSPYVYVETDKSQPVPHDAIVKNGDKILSVVETKCRNMTLDQLQNKYDNTWLITWEKLQSCVEVANQLDVPFYGFLYLIPERVLLIQQIWNKRRYVSLSKIETTQTQRTVNGGQTIRVNAFIDMRSAKVLRHP